MQGGQIRLADDAWVSRAFLAHLQGMRVREAKEFVRCVLPRPRLGRTGKENAKRVVEEAHGRECRFHAATGDDAVHICAFTTMFHPGIAESDGRDLQDVVERVARWRARLRSPEAATVAAAILAALPAAAPLW